MPETLWKPKSAREFAELADVDAQARRLGAQNKPDAAETRLMDPETMIVEEENDLNRRRREELEEEEATIRKDLAAVPTVDLEAATLLDNIENRLASTFLTQKDKIRKVVADYEGSSARRKAFIEKWNLGENLPTYATSRLKHYGLLGVCFVADLGLTFGAYMQVNKIVIMAMLVAAAVSVGNVGLGSVGGVVARYLRFKDPPNDGQLRLTRLRAIPILFVIVAAVVIWNIGAAFYRDGGGALMKGMSQMASDPERFSGATLFVFVSGCLISFFTGYKVFKASAFPGFEKVDREYIRDRQAMLAVKADLEGAVDGVRDGDVEALWQKRLAVGSVIDQAKRDAVALDLKRARARELGEEEVGAACQAITRFRRQVLAIRSDGVVPAYFAEMPTFREVRFDALGDLKAEIAAVEAEHQARSASVIDTICTARRLVERVKYHSEVVMHAIARSKPGEGSAVGVLTTLMRSERAEAARLALEPATEEKEPA